MAIPLIILAIGSIVAGYIGIPHALGGHNWIHGFLDPVFTFGAHAAEAAHEDTAMELMLMGVSTAVAFLGIGIGCLLAPARARLFAWFPVLTAALTPPPGARDTDLSDNSRRLELR
mgnify:CR=1 FL=1